MQIETRPAYEYDENLPNSEMMMMTSFASTSPPTLGYIAVSKLDTLAGIAIKYGVEVFFLIFLMILEFHIFLMILDAKNLLYK